MAIPYAAGKNPPSGSSLSGIVRNDGPRVARAVKAGKSRAETGESGRVGGGTIGLRGLPFPTRPNAFTFLRRRARRCGDERGVEIFQRRHRDRIAGL